MDRNSHRFHLLHRAFQLAELISFAAAFCSPNAAFARTSGEVEMTCPYDGTKFSFEAQMSGASFGTTLDFMPVGPIQSPWPLAVCTTNGFVFFKDKFDDDELEHLRPLIFSPDYQALKNESPYYRAAWIGKHTGVSHAQVSLTLLEATWEVFGDPQRYSRYATELAARLSEDVETSEPDKKRMFQLLQGEIMRRIGKFDEAKQYFQNWSKELEPTSNEALFATFEIGLISKKDTQPHLMAEAIRFAEDDPATWLARRTPALSGTKILKQTHTFKFDRGRNIHWTMDGRLIGGKDSELVLFDQSNNTTKPVESSSTWANEVAFSQDGKDIVFQEYIDRSWRLAQMDAFSFKALPSLELPVPGTQKIVMAYDGKSALTELDNELFAFGLNSNTLHSLSSPVFSQGNWWLQASDPSGPRIVLLHEDQIVIWNYAKGKLEHLLRPSGWTKSMTSVSVIYSRDAKKFFVAADAYWDGECELTAWDSDTGAQLSRKRVKGHLGARLAISSDSRLVALACGKSLYLWDSNLTDPPVETAEAIDSATFRAIEFSPNSQNLAVQMDDAVITYLVLVAGAERH